ncbi:MAG: hypothetical protein ACRD1F_02515 [Terriglobales bacterium]
MHGKANALIWLAIIGALAVGLNATRRDGARLASADKLNQYRAKLNERIAIRAVGGVDIWGRQQYPTNPRVKCYIVFLLQRRSIAADVSFWAEVASLVQERDGASVAFYGYSGGLSCSRALRARGFLRFPVIEFAAENSLQAILNANGHGDFLLLGPDAATLSSPAWRGVSTTAARVAARIEADVAKID